MFYHSIDHCKSQLSHDYGVEHIKAWLSDVLRNEAKLDITGSTHLIQEYFKAVTIEFRRCSPRTKKQNLGGTHICIQRKPHLKFFFVLDNDLHEAHNGSASSWLKTITSPASSVKRPKVHMERGNCWRRERYSGAKNCNGKAVTTTLHLSMPIFLVLEVSPSQSTRSSRSHKPTSRSQSHRLPKWNFQDKIVIAPKGTQPGDEDIRYRLAGRVLHSRKDHHFMARFEGILDSKRTFAPIYHYDDLSDGGHARLLGSRKDYLSGLDSQIHLPKGYNTKFVIYLLEGGTQAQETFLERQLRAVDDLLHLSLSSTDLASLPAALVSLNEPGTHLVPDSERTWCSEPHLRDFAEYSTDESTAVEPVAHQKSKAPPKPRRKLQASQAPGDDLKSMYKDLPSSSSRAKHRHLDQPEHDEGPKQDVLAIDSDPEPGISPSLPGNHDPSDESSDFILDCRCGAQGDGRKLGNGLDVIECSSCKHWSHQSCQRGGCEAFVLAKEPFLCAMCSLPGFVKGHGGEPRYIRFTCTVVPDCNSFLIFLGLYNRQSRRRSSRRHKIPLHKRFMYVVCLQISLQNIFTKDS